MSKTNSTFPKELRFFSFLCWLSVVALAMSFPILILGFFADGISDQKKILIFISLVAALLEFILAAAILRLLKRPESTIPDRIVRFLSWTLLIAVCSALTKVVFMSLSQYPQITEALKDISATLAAVILGYLYFSMQFRYLDSVANYYGANASNSRLKFVRRLGSFLYKFFRYESAA